jgi:ribosomal protein S18 acetylase RimI-like enzyme
MAAIFAQRRPGAWDPGGVDRRFGPEYRETVTLRDGSTVELRPIRPDDKARLVEAFARLSPESRYLRFFTGKDHLSADELRFLTEVDGEQHFALAATLPDGAGAGVVRFVRLKDQPHVAELAITVVDAMQHKGLGRILLDRLVEAARERGVTHFRAEVLATNAPMLALLEGQVATQTRSGSLLVVDFPLPDPAPSPSGARLTRFLELSAKRLLSFPRAFDREPE